MPTPLQKMALSEVTLMIPPVLNNSVTYGRSILCKTLKLIDTLNTTQFNCLIEFYFDRVRVLINTFIEMQVKEESSLLLQIMPFLEGGRHV